MAENSIEQTSNDDKYPATKPVEEVAGQRDTKSADAVDSADSMIIRAEPSLYSGVHILY